ncbi:hypothetical protein PPERSA_10285 [Pseudocohnilembus persalinus]|uniref:EF-hand domain-containing protein n=1 Tax=Pseudocohnilembus persalinus TaxID=266149 RepID=A0A0V0R031_PSEPJ|nr:hypothetical protein PPERSA_10285 [Pseudocohnilembus persalinus]|eukprot:KRX07897.1 hypothetical protein PPERSA_10285 [Pseudocohnilembus persalinus]
MEENQVKEIFNKIDKDGNGTISFEEFSEILKELNIDLTQYKVKKIFRQLDINKDEKVSYQEFLLWWQQGHQKGLEKLVFLSLKANKIMNKVNKKMDKTGGIDVDVNDIVEHDLRLAVGDAPTKSYIGLNVVGNEESEKISKNLIDGFENINQKNPAIVIKIGTSDVEAAKESFTDLMEQIFTLAETLAPPEIADSYLSAIKYEVISKDNFVLIGIQAQNEILDKLIDDVHQFLAFVPKETPLKAQFNINFGTTIGELLDHKDQNVQEVAKDLSLNINFNLKAGRQIVQKARDLGLASLLSKAYGKTEKFQAALGCNLAMLSAAKLHLQYKSVTDLMNSTYDFPQDATLGSYLKKISEEVELDEIGGQVPLFEEIVDAFKNNANSDISINVLGPRVAVSLEAQTHGVQQLYDYVFQQQE